MKVLNHKCKRKVNSLKRESLTNKKYLKTMKVLNHKCKKNINMK